MVVYTVTLIAVHGCQYRYIIAVHDFQYRYIIAVHDCQYRYIIAVPGSIQVHSYTIVVFTDT